MMNESVSCPIVVTVMHYCVLSSFIVVYLCFTYLALLGMIKKPTGYNNRMTNDFIEFPLSQVANL
jgi:hypothetical protein